MQTTEVVTPDTTTPVQPKLSNMEKAAKALGEAQLGKIEEPAKEEAPKEAAPTEEKPKEEQKPDVNAQRFAQIAKKEKALLELQRQIKSKEESLVKREEEIRAKVLEELKTIAKTKPTEALAKLETDYKTVTDYILNNEQITPEIVKKSTDSELEKIRAELEATKKQIQEDKAQQAESEKQRILKAFNDNVIDTVKKNSEKFELINLFGQEQAVIARIEQHWKETCDETGQNGEILSTEQAAEQLEEMLTKECEKVFKAKKFSQRLASQPKTDAPKPTSQKSQTLTNEITTSAPSMLSAKTEQDRLRRALEKLANA